MDFLRKNKVIAIVVAVVIVLAIGGLLFMRARTPGDSSDSTDITQNIKKLTPADIGLVLTPRADGHAISMEINKLDGIKTIEYDVSYDANVTEEGETATVPRGVVGSPIEVKSGESRVSRDLDLGTCSRNVCKYDDVVSDVKFVIKITYTNGEVASVEDTVSLE